jgi:ATP-dependent helicase HrpB
VLPLPIDGHIASVREHLRVHRAAVLVATPGAGKTTRVPPALATDGTVLVLQPRRAAARALARRVAEEQGWTLAREVGWHVRFEAHYSRETRVLFATEGILTARLQQDPLLSDITTVVLDEFHERSVHADLGLALVRQAWLARDDLRVLVMSATIDAAPVSRFLDDCPVVTVDAAPHPLSIRYEPEASLASAVERVLHDRPGNILCFLPGSREIDRAARDIEAIAGRAGAGVRPLHGTLTAEAQDDVLTPGPIRRVVLATNIAETSVTVPGVRTVIDSGWQKVARYDAARALDTLQTERVSADAADQRAGRAARLGPGLAIRLWAERDKLRPFREPDIARIDLAPVLLAILAWGGDDRTFEWFDAPADARRIDARRLLMRLGAIADTGLTAAGRQLARLPLPPRLSRMVVAADGHEDACLLAALLTDGRAPTPDGRTTASDLLGLIAGARAVPHLRRAARSVRAALGELAGVAPQQRGRDRRDDAPIAEDLLCRAVLAGFPDRVAQRRVQHGDALLLAAGTGARLSPASGVRNAAWLVALDVRGSEGREAVVQLASGIERDWLAPTHTERRVWVDETGRLRAARVRRYDALPLQEQPDALQAEDRAVLARAWQDAPRRPEERQLLARLAFAGIALDLDAVLATAVADLTRLDQIDLEAALPWELRQRLLTDAPARLPLPSGRTAALAYDDHGRIVRAAVKLQELFGLGETPRIGPRRDPVVFELLAPNGRPVQTTQDLRSFWTTTYAEVRKELRARYPKHPWPDDPWTATPTHRATRSRR